MSAYLLNTPEDVAAMLARIGVPSVESLFANIPADVRFTRLLDIPPALSEIELTAHMAGLAGKNVSSSEAVCFLGGGAYDHFIPSVVDAVAGRGEFYTAYTPYQAEARRSGRHRTSQPVRSRRGSRIRRFPVASPGRRERPRRRRTRESASSQ